MFVAITLATLTIYWNSSFMRCDKTTKVEYQDVEKTISIGPRYERNRVLVSSPPKGTQMGEAQIAKIKQAIPPGGNLLVWGLGNDSPFWNDITTGKVVFLEDDIPFTKAGTQWFDTITARYPFLEAYKMHYTTELEKSFQRYAGHPERWSELKVKLPTSVESTHWDVIIVDAPLGCCGQGPGRYGSLYTTKLLGKAGTHVFVDDYERKVERIFSQDFFGVPLEVTSRLDNEQAHFIIGKMGNRSVAQEGLTVGKPVVGRDKIDHRQR